MSWTVEKANEQFEVFKKRAEEDAEFRALALDDPARAIKQLTGMDLPEGIEITITEDEKGQLQAKTLVTPAAGERELDESELEQVAGGTSFSAFILYGPPYPPKKKK